MRIVDEDRRAVALPDQFDPPFRTFQSFERMKHRGRIASRGDRHAGRDQGILDLERADERQPYAIGLARVLQAQCL